MPAAPQKSAILSDTDGDLFDVNPRMEDSLGLIAHCLLDETGAAGALVVAEMEPGDDFQVSAGRSLSFLIGEVDGVLHYALRASGLTTRRMPAPADSGFSEVAFAAIRSPAGRRGAIFLGFADREFPEGEALPWTLDTYARLAAICLDSGSGFQRLMAAATIDALTGCLNYSALRFTLDTEIARATRYGLKLSVCFVDLDQFKTLNDDEGHEIGNRVLAEVGAILRAEARASDTVARYGGDEFVLMLPETSLRSATRFAKRLRGALAHVSTPAGTSVGASAGVAQWNRGISAGALLTAADDALRRAKLEGSGVKRA